MPPIRPTVSVIIPTAYRDQTLRRTFERLAAQTHVPDEIIVIDAAPSPGAEAVVNDGWAPGLQIVYLRSAQASAAVQRNAGINRAAGDIVIFLDDDAYPEDDCLEKMTRVFQDDVEERIGGVGVLIRNQLCPPPSPLAKRWFDFLADERRPSYSGMVIGPAIAIGPEPTSAAGIVRVDWLMSTCAAYRRTALPAGGFTDKFSGYSYMEDVDLSLRVARTHELVVHTGAYVYHDSQPSQFKRPYVRAKMTVLNRYYVMTVTLGRKTLSHHMRFLASLVVPHITSLRSVSSPHDVWDWLLSIGGTISGLSRIVLSPL